MLYVPPDTVSVAGADAVFHLIAARALFCASVFETGRLSIPGCIGIDAGQLTGKGERVQNQSTQHAPWLGAGLSAVPEIALTACSRSSSAWVCASWGRPIISSSNLASRFTTSRDSLGISGWASPCVRIDCGFSLAAKNVFDGDR